MNTPSLDTLRAAAESQPSQPTSWLAYAQAAANARAWSEAESAFGHLHKLMPQHAAVFRNWLRCLERLGRIDEALTHAAQWQRVHPTDRSMLQRAVTLAQTGERADIEEGALRRLIALEPNESEHVTRLVRALTNFGRMPEALTLYESAIKRWPKDLQLLWQGTAMVDAVPKDVHAIMQDRQRNANALAQLEQFDGPYANAIGAVSKSAFYFAYHGVNEVDRARRTGRLIEKQVHAMNPEFSFPFARQPLRQRKYRVAFASSLWRKHTVARYFGTWVQKLDRERFEVALAHDDFRRDAVTEALEASVDAVLRDEEEIGFGRVIADWQPDAIVFVDIGMVSKHMPLFAHRIAPVQIAAWGHPVTTGFSTIDAYLTVAAMEPSNWRAHYTEKEVIQLPGIGIDYPRPPLPPAAPRSELGLPDNAPIAICLQSLFKCLPEDDARFADILARVPNARLALFSLGNRLEAMRYVDRLAQVLRARDIDPMRVILLPQVEHKIFLQIISASDVVLDTHHFSGGNSSLDALACGAPVVTMPGEFMRGRQTTGMLQLIGHEELIATNSEDYVNKAVAILSGALHVDREQLRRDADALFDDEAPIRALENALEVAIRSKLS